MDKFIEKCAHIQFTKYLGENSLFGRFQSVYREGHSTETALLRVHNDIMLSLNRRVDVVLILLDLSAECEDRKVTIVFDKISQFGSSNEYFH